MIAFIILISLAFAISFPSSYGSNYVQLEEYLTQEVIALAFLLMLISVILISIVYVISNAISNDKLKAWAKSEIFEVLYSAILFGVIVFAIVSFDTVVNYLVFQQLGTDTFAAAVCNGGSLNLQGTNYQQIPFCHIKLSMYFLGSLFNELSTMAFKTYQSYTITSTIADMSVNFELLTEKSGNFIFNPWRGCFVIGNQIKTMGFEFITKLMTITKLQEVFVTFIGKALFPVLLSLGIVLRSFPYTRKLGGLLMAIAISLFFIYPMFYVFGAFVMNAIKIDARQYLALNGQQGSALWQNPPIADYLYFKGKVPSLNPNLPDVDLQQAVTDYTTAPPKQPFEIFRDAGSPYDPANQQGGMPNPRPFDRSLAPSNSQVETFGDYMYTFVKKLTSTISCDIAVDDGLEDGGLMDAIARLSFFSGFFFILAIFTTIASIRSLSITLGGDLEIAGLTHLI